MKPRTRTAIVALAVATACLAALAVAAYLWARDIQKTAETGKAQAQAGAKSLAAQDATGAVTHFGAASRSFVRARAMLGPEWVESIAQAVPPAGRQYSAAASLLAIGLDGSTAGQELAEVLREAPAASATVGASRMGSMLAGGKGHIDGALVAMADAAERLSRLSEDGLVPPLAKAVRSLKETSAELTPFLGRSRALLALERYLLSSDHRVLVISQDSAELRPTGGFAGSFGILDIGPSGIKLVKYSDVYALPDVPGSIPRPPGMRFKVFAFRDANWWLDFPTSARAMLTFWREYRQPPVDAVIAVDIVAVRDLLKVLGPITVPGYGETLSGDNLLQRLLYLVEVQSGGGSGKKRILVAFAHEVEKRLLSADPDKLAGATLAVAKAADAKHVQLYFTNAGAQAAIRALGWSGGLSPPEGTTDLLAVSNNMNLPTKANVAMSKTIDYRVALMPGGSADTTLVLGYANTGPLLLPGYRSEFGDYLQVRRATGTVVVPNSPPTADGSTTTVDAGLPTVVREFIMRRGRVRRETIVTRVPGAWRPAAGAAPGSASRYRLFVVRQADLQDVPTTITVTPPPGWNISSARARKSASGQALVISVEPGRARLALPLSVDMILDVGLERR